MYGWMVITYSKGKDQPGKVANPVANPPRAQLNRTGKMFFFHVIICRSRETGSAVPSRVSLLTSILWLNLVLTFGIDPEFRGGVHLFS